MSITGGDTTGGKGRRQVSTDLQHRREQPTQIYTTMRWTGPPNHRYGVLETVLQALRECLNERADRRRPEKHGMGVRREPGSDAAATGAQPTPLPARTEAVVCCKPNGGKLTVRFCSQPDRKGDRREFLSNIQMQPETKRNPRTPQPPGPSQQAGPYTAQRQGLIFQHFGLGQVNVNALQNAHLAHQPGQMTLRRQPVPGKMQAEQQSDTTTAGSRTPGERQIGQAAQGTQAAPNTRGSHRQRHQEPRTCGTYELDNNTSLQIYIVHSHGKYGVQITDEVMMPDNYAKPATHLNDTAGSLIGKQGTTIIRLQRASECTIQIVDRRTRRDKTKKKNPTGPTPQFRTQLKWHGNGNERKYHFQKALLMIGAEVNNGIQEEAKSQLQNWFQRHGLQNNTEMLDDLGVKTQGDLRYITADFIEKTNRDAISKEKLKAVCKAYVAD